MPSGIKIASLDHLVLTVADIAASQDFYHRVLGMRKVSFGEGREALHFGRQKINLHRAGHEFEPKARRATPGSGDFCFILEQPIEQAIAHLAREKIAVELGPVERTGAVGRLRSIYLRDPDGNLVELSNLI
jgi:catechol 2,3-dioxygenase-like lactoylglutathione lyase family enzyme